MKMIVLCFFLTMPVLCWAESDSGQEPNLYDHYVSLKRMEESLAGRSLEEQTRLQPQIQRAEQKACDRLRKERQDHVPKEQYRQQGGDQFLVFAQQLEQYCEISR
jgi:hypothetical protein